MVVVRPKNISSLTSSAHDAHLSIIAIHHVSIYNEMTLSAPFPNDGSANIKVSQNNVEDISSPCLLLAKLPSKSEHLGVKRSRFRTTRGVRVLSHKGLIPVYVSFFV